MKIIYCTLNNNDDARTISKDLLEKKLTNCTNWYPITCMYNWEDKITEEPEVVLIIKTIDGKFEDIVEVIKSHINYTNFISEFNAESTNKEFIDWIYSVVK
jgi:periplasmic divalent cation tolerance protein